MSGYRCVNYYELCRLCTASHGTKKVNIFSEEGRKKNLHEKISGCLPIIVSLNQLNGWKNGILIKKKKFISFIQVSESDKLPKIVCSQCLTQVETMAKFRETCVNAQTMLESCLNSSKLRNGGKVCIILISFYFYFIYDAWQSETKKKKKILIYIRFISRMYHRKRQRHQHHRLYLKQLQTVIHRLQLAIQHLQKRPYKRIQMIF